MNVRLSPSQIALVREKVASGAYRDQDEVIAKALKMLDDDDRRARFDAAIEEAEADVREGRTVVVQSTEELLALIRDF
jgi:putative addiction module CopG family antidote